MNEKYIYISISKLDDKDDHLQVIIDSVNKGGYKHLVGVIKNNDVLSIEEGDDLEELSLMSAHRLNEIKKSSFIIIDWHDEREGILIDCGAAWALNIPLIILCDGLSHLPPDAESLAKSVIYWSDYNELRENLLREIKIEN